MRKNRIRTHTWYTALHLGLIVALLGVGVALAAGNVDPMDKWAWSANAGWINFAPDNGGVTVFDDHMEGYAWGENIGWIRLGTCAGSSPCTHANTAAGNYGVNNDGEGRLSGYAWGANVGWINFDPDGSEQVTIDPITGDFSGYAWGENIGWIHFQNDSAAYKVTTTWRSATFGDITIVKRAVPARALPGQTITYTLVYSNTGPGMATGVVISDSIPTNVGVTGVTSSTVGSGVFITQTSAAPNLAWRVNKLAVGERGVITITAMVSQNAPLISATFTNTAIITATNDSTATNNSSSVSVSVSLFHLTAHSPLTNAIGVAMSQNISASFDADVDAASVTSRTFTVRSSLRGLYTATATVSGNVLTLNPNRDFFTGEQVQVVSTAAISSTGGARLNTTQWGFTAGPVTNRCLGGFTDIGAGLTGVDFSSVAWGDYDKDGDLDILLTGLDNSGVAKVYRNDGGVFVESGTADDALTGVYYSSVAWGDYDNDGDLDILLTGYAGGYSNVAKVYRNAGGVFVDIGTADDALTGVAFSSVAWGDYDNDGDLDIFLTGINSSYDDVAKVYRNNGGVFADSGAADDALTGVIDSMAWGDYDNDGDLDILLIGSYGAMVYRNDGGVFVDSGAADDALTSVTAGSVAWGDYDNDGDLDILLTGNAPRSFDPSFNVAKVYRNDGGVFADIGAALTDVDESSVAWGDYDNDGDLDILFTGRNSDYDPVAKIYRNDDCADVQLAKRVESARVAPGEALTYTLSFSNAGLGLAYGVVISDRIPVSVTVTGVTSSTVASGVLITQTSGTPVFAWTVRNLAAGASGTITLTGVLVNDALVGQTVTNTGTIKALTDSTPANNSASAVFTVTRLDVLSARPGVALGGLVTISATVTPAQAALTVHFAIANNGGGHLSQTSATTDASGVATVRYTAPGALEEVQIDGELAGASGVHDSTTVYVGADTSAGDIETSASGAYTVGNIVTSYIKVVKHGKSAPIMGWAVFKSNPCPGQERGTKSHVSPFVDAMVEDVTGVDAVVITLRYTDTTNASQHRPNWCNHGTQEPVTATFAVDEINNTLVFTLTDATSPSLRQLEGTPFVIAGVSAPVTITVGSFTAVALPDRVRLTWQTLSEIGLTGFYLYRGAEAAGPGDRITADPLPAQGMGTPESFDYTYEDLTALPAAAARYYWLEELHGDGGAVRLGPVRVDGVGDRNVYLPTVQQGTAVEAPSEAAPPEEPGTSTDQTKEPSDGEQMLPSIYLPLIGR